MKIGIDCRMYATLHTGIGRYVYELVENLQEIDHQNHYVLFFNSPEFENFTPKHSNFTKVLVNALHYSFSEQTKFLRLLKKQKLDLMHFTHFNAPVLYFGPSVVTIHDLTVHFFPGKKMTSLFRRSAYHLAIKSAVSKAQKVISVSRSTAKDLQEVLHTPSSKIEVIYEGVNAEFSPVKDIHCLLDTLFKYHIDRSFLLYTGVWRDHKNLKGLIESFRELLKKKHHIQLVITGKKDNIYAEEIFALTEDLVKQNLVVFTDLVSDHELVDLINAAQIYVFPSFYEGFGLPPLEAMQCHTPVAASNTSSIPEICGNNAVYFDPHSIPEMTEAIEKLLTDKHLYHQLQLSGEKHVKKYSWSKMAKHTHQLYLDFLKDQSKPTKSS